MTVIVAKLIPVFITAAVLAVIMVLMMGVGWASGKLIRKLFGIGGK